MIVRAGGDEFYIIIPDCVKETADMYCNKIRHNFDRPPNAQNGRN